MCPLPWDIRCCHWSHCAVASHTSLLNYSEVRNASVCTGLKRDRTCGRGHVCITSSLMLLCFAYQFHIIMHIVPASERAHWHYSDPAHLHLMWICPRSERTGELARTLALGHSFILLTSWDVVLTRNGLKTFKSSTYCLLYAWRQCFKANIGARASLLMSSDWRGTGKQSKELTWTTKVSISIMFLLTLLLHDCFVDISRFTFYWRAFDSSPVFSVIPRSFNICSQRLFFSAMSHAFYNIPIFVWFKLN